VQQWHATHLVWSKKKPYCVIHISPNHSAELLDLNEPLDDDGHFDIIAVDVMQ
jgi:hypothetical protein